jgi:hypothetical protein
MYLKQLNIMSGCGAEWLGSRQGPVDSSLNTVTNVLFYKLRGISWSVVKLSVSQESSTSWSPMMNLTDHAGTFWLEDGVRVSIRHVMNLELFFFKLLCHETRLDTTWRGVVSATLRPFYLRGKKPWYFLNTRLGGPGASLDAAGKTEISCPLPGIEPRSSSS